MADAHGGAVTAATAAGFIPQPGRWPAKLDLRFDVAGGRTRLAGRKHSGPLMVQRPFHPEADGTCHVYLLHPPGGLAGGDELDIAVHVGGGARVLLTTPGATKFYRSSHGRSSQRVQFDIGKAATCEYLPQETILFDGADADIATRAALAADACFVGWEFLCLGRPAARERFESGAVSQRFEITRGSRLVRFERFGLTGGSPLLDARFALSGNPVFGSMVYVGAPDDDVTERVSKAVGETAGAFSVTQLTETVVCRYLGPQAAEGKMLFARAWDALRIHCQGKSAHPPRIWAT